MSLGSTLRETVCDKVSHQMCNVEKQIYTLFFNIKKIGPISLSDTRWQLVALFFVLFKNCFTSYSRWTGQNVHSTEMVFAELMDVAYWWSEGLRLACFVKKITRFSIYYWDFMVEYLFMQFICYLNFVVIYTLFSAKYLFIPSLSAFAVSTALSVSVKYFHAFCQNCYIICKLLQHSAATPWTLT